MAAPSASAATPRRITCARCGTAFDCGLSGACWCAAEPYRMPLGESAEDCLCPTCLRKTASSAAASTAAPPR